jgi:hypothetical protein
MRLVSGTGFLSSRRHSLQCQECHASHRWRLLSAIKFFEGYGLSPLSTNQVLTVCLSFLLWHCIVWLESYEHRESNICTFLFQTRQSSFVYSAKGPNYRCVELKNNPDTRCDALPVHLSPSASRGGEGIQKF